MGVANEFRSFFRRDPDVTASAPGRVDFLNTHQDYKGLPVVAIGINLRVFTAVRRSSSGDVTVVSGNLMDEGLPCIARFNARDPYPIEGRSFSSYVKAVVAALMRQGIEVGGFNAFIRGYLPIASGLGSSAALAVSLLWGLNELFSLGLGRVEVAETAYRAEHDVMGIPCGRLDQYASAFGGVSLIRTRPPCIVEELPRINGSLTVLDTGVKHSTAEIHPVRQGELAEALQLILRECSDPGLRSKLSSNYWDVAWEELSEEELKPYVNALPGRLARRVLFTLRMHRSTVLAVRALKGGVTKDLVDEVAEVIGRSMKDTLSEAGGGADALLRLVGAIMTYQHRLLSELYEVSSPALDGLVEVSLKAGAYGAKLSGAGLGGAVVALSPNAEVAEAVVRAGVGAGAREGWVVEVDEGVKVH